MVDAPPPDPPPPAGAVRRIRGDGRADLLVREEPLLLVIHGQQLLTMRTPGRDDDLALGFLLGEGIVAAAADVRATTAVAADAARGQPDELRVTLAREPDARVRGRLARTHEIRSSCGVCGMADPSALLDDLPPLLPGVPRLPREGVARLVQLLGAHQPLFAATGGCHAAVIAGVDGTLLGHGEDVGRHNALDKAIGMAARAGAELDRSVAVLSGRAGFDLVLKCLRVRIPVVVSVSAPSGLAFDLCQAAGATLLGFARGQDHRVYTDGARLC